MNCHCTYVCTNASRHSYSVFCGEFDHFDQKYRICTSLALYKTSILLSNTSTGMQAVPKHVALWNINIHFGGGGYSYIHVPHDLIEVDECANCC